MKVADGRKMLNDVDRESERRVEGERKVFARGCDGGGCICCRRQGKRGKCERKMRGKGDNQKRKGKRLSCFSPSRGRQKKEPNQVLRDGDNYKGTRLRRKKCRWEKEKGLIRKQCSSVVKKTNKKIQEKKEKLGNIVKIKPGKSETGKLGNLHTRVE